MKCTIRLPNWPMLLIIAVLVATIVSAVTAWLPPLIQVNVAVYWFDLWYPDLRKGLALACIPLSFIIFIIRMFWLLFINKDELVRLWVFPILFIANIVACASCIPGAVYMNEHQDSLYYNNRIYYVMWSYGLIGIGGVTRPYIFMYECDGFGLFCQIINTYGGWREHTADLDSHPWKAQLAEDSDINAILLEVNNEIVYTHHPG